MRIWLPGCNSKFFFFLSRGMRQGYPLSALLFTLAIELLATVLLSHSDIKGYTLFNHTYKFSMYADDILPFRYTTYHFIIKLKTLQYFASLSGLTIKVCVNAKV